MDYVKLLTESAEHFGVEIDGINAQKFLKYKQLLIEWNEKINLTSITDDEEIIIKHFVDSLSLASCTDFTKNMKVIDIGTGAGFPGIPLKIVYPDISVVLMDSLNKRVKFLHDVIDKLELENIEAVHMRAEDGGRDIQYREKFDLACARAVKNLTVLSEYCLPYVKVNGIFVAMKGPNISEEIGESESIIKDLGGKIVEVKNIVLPSTDIKRTLIVIKKFRHTISKYPRNQSQMIKKQINNVDKSKKFK